MALANKERPAILASDMSAMATSVMPEQNAKILQRAPNRRPTGPMGVGMSSAAFKRSAKGASKKYQYTHEIIDSLFNGAFLKPKKKAESPPPFGADRAITS